MPLIGYEKAFDMLRTLDALCSKISRSYVRDGEDHGDTEENINACKVEYFDLYRKVADIIAFAPDPDVDDDVQGS